MAELLHIDFVMHGCVHKIFVRPEIAQSMKIKCGVRHYNLFVKYNFGPRAPNYLA
jgi:hypothetical protein